MRLHEVAVLTTARQFRERATLPFPVEAAAAPRETKEPAKWASMLLVERLSYFMVLSPFLVDYARTGKAPAYPGGWLADAVLGLVILAFALLMRHNRRRADLVDSLRRTLNESIVHDLKNPMTSVMACISCMLESAPDSARQSVLLKIALSACRTQVTLIETLVDTSRLEHGELRARSEPMDARKMLDACLSSVRGTALHLGVELKETGSRTLPKELRCDPELLPRVFVNLLLNALKYSAKGDCVSLNADFKNESFFFEITDTGIGIAPEHIERLFKKYYRVEGPSQNTRRGSGLGLYFSRLVVEAHGGKIDVQSSVGHGTKVTFSIPQHFRPEARI
jgi:signal transduction histidine kinase